jgi:hypothetical protein
LKQPYLQAQHGDQIPLSYPELCDFIQYIALVETKFGILNKARKSIAHLIDFASKQETNVWSLIEELCIKKACSEVVRLMSQPARKVIEERTSTRRETNTRVIAHDSHSSRFREKPDHLRMHKMKDE